MNKAEVVCFTRQDEVREDSNSLGESAGSALENPRLNAIAI